MRLADTCGLLCSQIRVTSPAAVSSSANGEGGAVTYCSQIMSGSLFVFYCLHRHPPRP